jgi:hypothetical protein
MDPNLDFREISWKSYTITADSGKGTSSGVIATIRCAQVIVIAYCSSIDTVSSNIVTFMSYTCSVINATVLCKANRIAERYSVMCTSTSNIAAINGTWVQISYVSVFFKMYLLPSQFIV